MFASTRQPGWGLVSILGGIAAIVVLGQYWHSSKPPPPSTRPSWVASRARGIFAPMEPGRPFSRATGPTPATSPGETPRRETISGRVVAPDGAPIAGAVVTLGKDAEVSDSDGRFQIPTGSGRLSVRHAGHFPRDVSAEGVKTMSLVLVPGSRVMGKITGPGGQGVASARVQFGTSEEPPAALTDPTGRYESPLLPRGPVCGVVFHPGHQPRSRVLTLREPMERWDVQLASGDRLMVAALEEDGSSLPDAEVWMGSAGPTESTVETSEWRFLGRTDDLGRLETCKETGVRATLRISLPGHRDAVMAVEPSGGEITARMRQAPALRGQAVDSLTGLPVRIALLRLETLAGERYVETPHRGLLFQSLEIGKFVVGLPPQPGTYRLHVRAASSDERERDLQGESEPFSFDGVAEPPPFVVRLEERIELRGVVQGQIGTFDGLAVELLFDAPPESILGSLEEGPERRWVVAGVRVPAPLRKVRQIATDPRGRFAFEGLSHGTYRIRLKPAEPGAFAEYLSAPFALPWEGEFPVQLRRGSVVAGRILDARGTPRPGAPVLLIHEDDWARLTHTDAGGRFELRDVGPGAGYRLAVGSEGEAVSGEAFERALVVEEGRDVTYDLHPEEWSGPTAPAPASVPHPEPELDSTSLVRSSAREDDLVLSPAEAAAKTSSEDFDPGWAEAQESAALDDLAGLKAPETPLEPLPEPSAAPDPAPPPGESPRQGSGTVRLQLFDAATKRKFPLDAEIEVEEVGGKRGWRGRASEGELSIRGLANGPHRVRVKARGLVLDEKQIDVQGDATATFSLEEPHDVAVRLQKADGQPFRGLATVVLRGAGREILRRVENIQETLTVPTPGPGEYELSVESEDFESRMRVRVTRELEASEKH